MLVLSKRIAALLIAAPILAPLPSFAQSPAGAYPSKQIRIILPFPPGGFNDTLARILANELPKTLGQPAVVDNRPGGNTVIGTEMAAKAPPDGHTLFVAALPFSVVQSLVKTPFDVTRDFAPIVLAGTSNNLLVANPNFPPNTVKELIDYARKNPGRVNYGSAGSGTSPHLSMELLKSMTKVFMTHIPYRGSAPVVADLLGGQVDVMFDNVPNVVQHVKAGRMKALGVSGATRSALAPEVPTVAEAGIPGFQVTVWFGLLAPAGTPRDIVLKLNGEMTRILNQPDIKARIAGQGVDVQTGTPEQFGDLIKSEVARWAKVIKEAGIKVD